MTMSELVDNVIRQYCEDNDLLDKESDVRHALGHLIELFGDQYEDYIVNKYGLEEL